ncbi:MAG: hypothetical protein RML93_05330 [Anaerolineales bacterium]|nr:hypothetical protein [Anaerolineales bacterium]MCS7247139.1 hypothetical protein [Anaerolineales bacterium]MDW8160950.1 hypothetical protein [Anaerolineales bacterium]MDW8446696.1 hypothetical protein [Anaerolineales bacterium]
MNEPTLPLQKHLFAGLIFDEQGQPVEAVYVGREPCYVVNDRGFRRHIPAIEVDRQVFEAIVKQIQGHEDFISEQAAKMLGQDDPFSKAMIATQLRNISQQFPLLLITGIPEETRAYLGMTGFKIIINVHGEVIQIAQPGMINPDEEQ